MAEESTVDDRLRMRGSPVADDRLIPSPPLGHMLVPRIPDGNVMKYDYIVTPFIQSKPGASHRLLGWRSEELAWRSERLFLDIIGYILELEIRP